MEISETYMKILLALAAFVYLSRFGDSWYS